MAGIWRLLFVLWAGSMLSACVAPLEFTSPLADPGTERVDPLLVGTWYGVSRCENDRSGPFDVGICDKTGGPPVMLTTLHLAAAPDGTSLAVRANVQALDVSDIIKEARDRVHGRVLQFQATAFPATLDGVAYYNIRRAAGVGVPAFGHQAPVELGDAPRQQHVGNGFVLKISIAGDGLVLNERGIVGDEDDPAADGATALRNRAGCASTRPA